jgi:ppGpp synthetase/RelA/SpoT-type nucleotidyltranferase
VNEQKNYTESFDFENHRLQAIEKYQKVRPLYEEFSGVVKNILSEAFNAKRIKIHSIEARAKEIESFGSKASSPSQDDISRPQYPNPLSEVTDLAGIRVITFFPKTLETVDNTIRLQFNIVEKLDKTQILIKEEKLGYGSIHYLVCLKDDRTNLLEYSRFQNLVAEIQVRTILQHAWAEIEHDIQYKSIEIIPSTIRRRFMSLAGMLEIADREFQAIQDEDEKLRKQARKSVREGKLEMIEITPDALKAYLNKKLGADGRMKPFSYDFSATGLRRLGFTDFKQIDECISGYDDDNLSRIAWGTRQGQITRFELQLLAGMGVNYIQLHRWNKYKWFVESRNGKLEDFKKEGIKVGSYIPPTKRPVEPSAVLDSRS